MITIGIYSTICKYFFLLKYYLHSEIMLFSETMTTFQIIDKSDYSPLLFTVSEVTSILMQIS